MELYPVGCLLIIGCAIGKDTELQESDRNMFGLSIDPMFVASDMNGGCSLWAKLTEIKKVCQF